MVPRWRQVELAWDGEHLRDAKVNRRANAQVKLAADAPRVRGELAVAGGKLPRHTRFAEAAIRLGRRRLSGRDAGRRAYFLGSVRCFQCLSSSHAFLLALLSADVSGNIRIFDSTCYELLPEQL